MGDNRHFKFLIDTIPAQQNAIWKIHSNFLSVLKINVNGSLELIWQPKVNINHIENQSIKEQWINSVLETAKFV